MNLDKKLKILISSAKYDVACSSIYLKNRNFLNLGYSSKCVPLLKVLFSNACIYDCAYCINRKSNNIPRATFSVNELVNITISFYKKNYTKGLFLSSAIIKNPDYTMEQMIKVVKKLRTKEKFNGYIHLKIIPGVDEKLIEEAGLYADRLSINVEFPTKKSLKFLAPDKEPESIQKPLIVSSKKYIETISEVKKYKHAKLFSPAGQTTQLIVGATPESDKKILSFADKLYKDYKLKRVYYSAYIAVNYDKKLPTTSESQIRENRLYQADFLIRLYNFRIEELFEKSERLDLKIDPKTKWAINHPEFFPIEINSASYDELIRVPGIGIKTAKLIIKARKLSSLNFDNLIKIGVLLKKAKYFITCNGKKYNNLERSTPLFSINFSKEEDKTECFSL
ncbi:putative DNA modification/repair radical SAM protein [Thermosipho atlanticus]|uniref:Putative DNA modification/repair radical SAM protein n=1 Tax=Thermosipho atlanticus DSM 15807 TaxID=1123380 RepID=A0A1M5TL85_9BACT|nr:putative DNA modification/repair radical SAM protein [Thermosipho atlanticus]SHH51575.1 putative DNA modification/repair radical SAM protein [Thermosipho atlanticus DSM 15807]